MKYNGVQSIKWIVFLLYNQNDQNMSQEGRWMKFQDTFESEILQLADCILRTYTGTEKLESFVL